MKLYKFNKTKYGVEFLIDLVKFEEKPDFRFEKETHATDWYEIFFFRKAAGVLQLDDQTIPLSNRLIVFASPYQLRSWQVDREETSGVFLIFAEEFLSLFFADPLFVFRMQLFYNQHTKPCLVETESAFEHYLRAVEAIDQELGRLKSDSDDVVRSFLYLMLVHLNRAYCQTHKLSPERRLNHEAYQFKKLVAEEVRRFQDVASYAQKLGVSRVTLNKSVKQQFGITASEYIKSRLLVEVKKDLLFTSKTIAEIAYDLCFSEPSSLIRFFKRKVGRSPGGFRAAYHKVNSA